MTQVAELFLEEGREQEKEKIILNLYKLGMELDRIAKATESDIDIVKQVITRS